MKKIYPILLAGGAGTRLWPLSRKSYPKQFSKIIGEKSLFQESALRVVSSENLQLENPIVLTNNSFRFIVVEQLNSVGIPPSAILIEPEAKSTAPAIIAATLYVASLDPDAIILVLPTDHLVGDKEEFHRSIANGIDAIELEALVTFGVQPDRPETGFGYLKLGEKSIGKAIRLESFVEKPDSDRAQEMYQSGEYLWNAGMFMGSVSTFMGYFEHLVPDDLSAVKNSLDKSVEDFGFLRLDPESWSRCNEESIDYAVMEQASNLMAIPLTCSWTDLGGWDAVWEQMEKDERDVAMSKNAYQISCDNTLLRSERSSQCIVGLGLNNIVAIAMPDAVLIADKERSQEVKAVVAKLKSEGELQAEVFPVDHRPWGNFESLVAQNRFQVKRITVNPGASLSLQSHHHRSEHWIVVEGTASVTINNETRLIAEGESVYVPLGAVHRMENPGKLPMVLIEVQTGAYLGEDDIIRYEDAYDRG